jgi:hypothetical protein
LHLTIYRVRRCKVLGIRLSHHELPEHLNLLHLGKSYFVAHLNRLQIACQPSGS